MNWYKCYDEKAGKWVEPWCVTRDGYGYWGDGDWKGRFREKAYRETGISVNGIELIEGDMVTCANPVSCGNDSIDGVVAFRDGNAIFKMEDGYYLLHDIARYGIVRTGHISWEGR